MVKESGNATFYTKMNSQVNHDSTTSIKETKKIDPKYDEFGENQKEKSKTYATIQAKEDQGLRETLVASIKDKNTNSKRSNCINDTISGKLEETIKERDILLEQLTVILMENELLQQQIKQRNENYDVLHEKVNGLKKYFLSMFP